MSLKLVNIEEQKYVTSYTPQEFSPELYLHQLEEANKPLDDISEVSSQGEVQNYQSEIIVSPEITQQTHTDYIIKPREISLSERIIEEPISPMHYTHSGLERRLYVPWHTREPSRINRYYSQGRISSLRYYRR